MVSLRLLVPSIANLTLSLTSASGLAYAKPIALITGGTRGIGSGIARVLAEAGYDLLLTYNSDEGAATAFAEALVADTNNDGKLSVECVGGDISLCDTRDAIFEKLDSMIANDDDIDTDNDGKDGNCDGVRRRLAVLVHNAGQYVGITSENSQGIAAGRKAFGDGSLLDESGRTDFETMHYYQRMYGEAFVDLCERSLVRMGGDGSTAENGDEEIGGSIIGISSPSVSAHLYGPDPSYSLPGAGKSLMEYSMRIYAQKAGAKNINVNVIVPGYTQTEAWSRLAQKSFGMDDETEWMEGLAQRDVPLKKLVTPRIIGETVKFLCSECGKFVTGQVIPVDGGLHLNK